MFWPDKLNEQVLIKIIFYCQNYNCMSNCNLLSFIHSMPNKKVLCSVIPRRVSEQFVPLMLLSGWVSASTPLFGCVAPRPKHNMGSFSVIFFIVLPFHCPGFTRVSKCHIPSQDFIITVFNYSIVLNVPPGNITSIRKWKVTPCYCP